MCLFVCWHKRKNEKTKEKKTKETKMIFYVPMLMPMPITSVSRVQSIIECDKRKKRKEICRQNKKDTTKWPTISMVTTTEKLTNQIKMNEPTTTTTLNVELFLGRFLFFFFFETIFDSFNFHKKCPWNASLAWIYDTILKTIRVASVMHSY